MLIDFEHLRDEFAMDKGEAEFLYGLVRALKPDICVETGTHKCLSSLSIANALEDNQNGQLYTCDPVNHGQREILGSVSKGLSERVTFQQIRGDKIKTPGKIDFAFIDGLHGIKDVLEEIDNIFPQLNENAVVVFHDANDSEAEGDGVNAAIKERKLKAVWLPTKWNLRIYCHAKN
jgi:predicted O-methyltransferase YrrM